MLGSKSGCPLCCTVAAWAHAESAAIEDQFFAAETTLQNRALLQFLCGPSLLIIVCFGRASSSHTQQMIPPSFLFYQIPLDAK